MIIKTVARIGAVLSFAFFFVAGTAILATTQYTAEYVVLVALGLFLVGTAFFAGALLWLAAERCSSKP